MLEPIHIKQEKCDSPSNAPVCTCKHDVKQSVPSVKNVRQVLVNFGLNRKKVFTLHGKNEKLYEQFKNHILSEPAFSELLEDSYVVFQEFSAKFGTWVDIDVNDKLKDGTVLNAVFFPNNIERDKFNPGCIKKKEILIMTEKVKKKRPLDIITLDSSDGDEQSASSVKNAKHNKKSKSSKARIEGQINGEEIEVGNLKSNEKKSKKIKSAVLDIDGLKKEEEEKHEGNLKKNKEQSKKKKKILPEDNDKKTVESKFMKNMETSDKKGEECMKKYESPIKTENFQNYDDDELKHVNLQKNSEQNKSWHQEVSNHSTWNRDLNIPGHHQNVHHEIRRGRNCNYPETADNFPDSNKAWQKNVNKTSKSLGQNGASFVTQIYDVCAKNKWPEPEFITKEEPKGFSCELKVKDSTYYKEHSESSKVEEAVAELALNRMKEEGGFSNNYNRQYRGSWQRGRRRPYRRGYMKSW